MTMTSGSARVFVYGTLRRGQRNHHVLAGSEMLGTCSTEARFTLIDAGGFPGAVPGGNQCVKGEVYEVEQSVLSYVDLLEAHPHFFRRAEISTMFGTCWTYLYRQAHGSEAVIGSGDWLNT